MRYEGLTLDPSNADIVELAFGGTPTGAIIGTGLTDAAKLSQDLTRNGLGPSVMDWAYGWVRDRADEHMSEEDHHDHDAWHAMSPAERREFIERQADVLGETLLAVLDNYSIDSPSGVR